ncbi:MAG TPA: PilZ domain-containing protein [Nitrospirales bacterium]
MRPNRRQSARTLLSSDATLFLNDAMWRGSTWDISEGGLSLIFEEMISVAENQTIQLSLEAEGGVFQLSGRVRGLMPHSTDAGSAPLLRMGVEFSALDPLKEQLFVSLLDGLRRDCVSLTVTGLLAPPNAADLLVARRPDDLDSTHVDHKAGPQERRLVQRLTMKMRVTLGQANASGPHEIVETEACDVSATGVLLRNHGHAVPGDDLNLRLLPEAHGLDSGSSKTDAQQGHNLTGRVVWASAASGLMGVQFFPGVNESSQPIAQLVQDAITAREVSEAQSPAVSITSTPLEFRNELGQRIAAYFDRSNELLPGNPVVIVVPGYGETKKEYIALSYYLACNGFQVLRYDHTNHVGESEGAPTQSTLGRMHRDLASALGYVKAECPQSPVVVIAASLAGRVLIKIMAHDRRVDLGVIIAGVVDVRQTLRAVHQQDLIEDYLLGAHCGVINMLGLNIQADRWLENAAAEGYADLTSTIRDIAGIKVPIALFAAEHDAWVDMHSVKQVITAIGPELGELVVIPEALHRLAENPRKARATFREIVALCARRLGEQIPGSIIREPAAGQIAQQGRLERERGRAHYQMGLATNVQFWEEYLGRSHFIVNVHDYWQLLDHVYRYLGVGETAVRILDAGCGNGHFGMFLLMNQQYRALKDDRRVPLIRYTGLDVAPAALREAQLELQEQALPPVGPHQIAPERHLISSFVCGNLNAPLPFANGEFDRVVCNLVLGYLDDASFTISEFLRVLSPGGKLILTNLKPNSDLSQIYRNFVRTAETTEDIGEARELLNNSGHLRQAESEGRFRSFDRQEFAMLLLSGGAEQVQIFTTFANQAYIAVAAKSGSMAATASIPAEAAYPDRLSRISRRIS